MENEKDINTDLNDCACCAECDCETKNDCGCNTDTSADFIAQITELNDKYLRIAAELENTRRRASIDMENAARNRAMSVVGNFLSLADAIDAAILHAPDDAGVKSMALALESIFDKIGVKKIICQDSQLNPMFHNVISVIDVPESDEPCAIKTAPGTIVGEIAAGYMFGDIVLRPAMVVVSK